MSLLCWLIQENGNNGFIQLLFPANSMLLHYIVQQSIQFNFLKQEGHDGPILLTCVHWNN